MTFLHAGLAVAGVAAVAIPIIIHLLMRRRRTPVRWAAMRFVIEAYKAQRRRLLVERWLLLAVRCLVVLLAGLAIARPALTGTGAAAGGRTVYLLVDNSIAAGVEPAGAPGTALERHRRTALGVLDALGAGATGELAADRCAVIALAGPAEPAILPASADLDAARAALNELAPSASRADLPGGLALAASAIRASLERDAAGPAPGRVFVVVLSDFYSGGAEVTAALPVLPPGVRVLASVPARDSPGNLAITGLDPLRPVMIGAGGASPHGAAERVRVRLRRSGNVERPAAGSVRVWAVPIAGGSPDAGRAGHARAEFAPGQEEAAVSVQVPVPVSTASPGASAMSFAPGAAVLLAELDDDALRADNRWRRPVEVRPALRVGIVAPRRFGPRGRVDELGAAEWVALALAPAAAPGAGGEIAVTQVEPTALDPAALVGLDAIIVPRPDLIATAAPGAASGTTGWDRLRRFAEAGGLVLVMPPAAATVHGWTEPMTRAFDLSWRPGRETSLLEPDGLAVETGSPGATPDTPASRAEAGPDVGDLLELLRGELEGLVRPVTVRRVLRPEGDLGPARPLLALADGTPLLLVQALAPRGAEPGAPASPGAATTGAPSGAPPPAGAPGARGLLVYLAVAPELSWTDLPAKPLMVPLVQELVRQGIGRARGSWSSVAGQPVSAPPGTLELVPVATGAPGGAEETGAGPLGGPIGVAPGGLAAEPVRRAGLFRAVDVRGGTRGHVAVNADERGSRLEPQARAQVEPWLSAAAGGSAVAWLEPPTGAAGRTQPESPASGVLGSIFAGPPSGPPLSVPLLIAAGLLALLEILLARLASHARPGAGGSPDLPGLAPGLTPGGPSAAGAAS
ncbi:MAG TPA: BatA domain-containing protein [Phycisphaerales bacterium]|nr:BatA domain-containing protein [Phycisphaerales bacterium]